MSLAVDIHDIPYYGKKSTKGIVGTKRRKLGTCWAFRYMTVCMTAMRDHYTLAGSPMTSFTSVPKMLKALLDQSMTYIDGHIGLAYVDRGFFNVPCIAVLESYPFRYLMPAIKNSKIKKIIKQTRKFPAVVPYTMGNEKGNVTFSLILLENKKKRNEIYAFATNMAVNVKDAEKLCDLYKNRFTIETSYRMLGEVRTKTTSHDYSVRWFFVLFGLLIRNGYFLFNDITNKIIHISLVTFAELILDIDLTAEVVSITKNGDG